MKVVQINSVCGKGSTGKICASISNLLTEQGIENYILHTTDGNTHPLGVQYMSSFSVKIQALKAKVFGNYGFQTRIATKRLIKKLDKISDQWKTENGKNEELRNAAIKVSKDLDNPKEAFIEFLQDRLVLERFYPEDITMSKQFEGLDLASFIKSQIEVED